MLPQSPLEYALWGGLIVVGWVLGYFGSTFEGKWRRRFHDERRFYAQYRDETDRLNIEKTRRIAELEAQKSALSQEVVRMRSDAAAAAAAAVAVAAPLAPLPLAAATPPEKPVEHDAVNHAEAGPEPVIQAADSAPVADTATHAPAPPEEPVAALPIMAAAAAPAVAAAITDPEILPHFETESTTAIPLAAHEEPAAAAEHPVPDAVAEDDHEPVQIDATLHTLTRIRGIDTTLAAGLGSLGVRQIEDIERLSAEDEKAIEIQLNLPPGQIANQQWRLQAALIGSGEDELIGA